MTRYASVLGPVLAIVAALVASGCDQPVAPANTSGAPYVVLLTVTGNTSLTALGETSQLTATAEYSDGTKRDAPDLIWSTQATGIATVSQTGLLTATGFGITQITARLPVARLQKNIQVSVIATGTVLTSGRVREPGSGGVRDVRVVEPISGTSALTDAEGRYTLVGLSALRLSFEKEGYEPATFDATPNGSDEVSMQRVIRIVPGESVAPIIAPHDMDYVIESSQHCSPCRLIRVACSSTGVVRVRVTWDKATAAVSFWIDGQRFERTASGVHEVVADVPVAPGELLVYVGSSLVTDYTPIVLTTALR